MHSPNSAFFILAAIFLFACSKNDDPVTRMDDASLGQVAFERVALSSHAFASVYKLVDLEARQHALLTKETNNPRTPQASVCGEASLTPGGNDGFPAILELDFGEGCSDANAHTLSGSVRATYTGPLGVRGTSFTIQLTALELDGFLLNGSFSGSDFGVDAQGNSSRRVDLIAATYTDPDGSSTTLDETAFITQIAGANTSYQSDGMNGLLDDVVNENRTSSLEISSGETFAVTTQDLLTRAVSCEFPLSGRLKMSSEALTGDAELDYDTDQCDSKATLYYEEEIISLDF